jgi:mitogen-activated protein kinase kinase
MLIFIYQAIVHGEPPTLPDSGYSDEAHAFVSACLNKNPNNRPTYSTLLRHPWLAPLMQPPDESDGADTTSTSLADGAPHSSTTEDKEVADWVKEMLERRHNGQLQDSDKPALHAVALDAVPGSPLLDDPSSISSALTRHITHV